VPVEESDGLVLSRPFMSATMAVLADLGARKWPGGRRAVVSKPETVRSARFMTKPILIGSVCDLFAFPTMPLHDSVITVGSATCAYPKIGRNVTAMITVHFIERAKRRSQIRGATL
jgi:hypothetical protein